MLHSGPLELEHIQRVSKHRLNGYGKVPYSLVSKPLQSVLQVPENKATQDLKKAVKRRIYPSDNNVTESLTICNSLVEIGSENAIDVVTIHLQPAALNVLNQLKQIRSGGTVMEGNIMTLGNGQLLYRNAFAQTLLKDCYVPLERNAYIDNLLTKKTKISGQSFPVTDRETLILPPYTKKRVSKDSINCDELQLPLSEEGSGSIGSISPSYTSTPTSVKRRSGRLLLKKKSYQSNLKNKSDRQRNVNGLRILRSVSSKPIVQRSDKEKATQNQCRIIYEDISFTSDSENSDEDSDSHKEIIYPTSYVSTQDQEIFNEGQMKPTNESVPVTLQKTNWRPFNLPPEYMTGWISTQNKVLDKSQTSMKNASVIIQNQLMEESNMELSYDFNSTRKLLLAESNVKEMAMTHDSEQDTNSNQPRLDQILNGTKKIIGNIHENFVERIYGMKESADSDQQDEIKSTTLGNANVSSYWNKKPLPGFTSIYYGKHLDTTLDNDPDSKYSIQNTTKLRKLFTNSESQRHLKIRIVKNDETDKLDSDREWSIRKKFLETSIGSAKSLNEAEVSEQNANRFGLLKELPGIPELDTSFEEDDQAGLGSGISGSLTVFKNQCNCQDEPISLENLLDDILCLEEEIERDKENYVEDCCKDLCDDQFNEDMNRVLSPLISNEDFERILIDLKRDLLLHAIQISNTIE